MLQQKMRIRYLERLHQTLDKKRPVIHELLVVEGLHDKQAVDEAVQADVWIIGGDRIANRFLQELERASCTRGIIIFTDPDGPGERIRRRIEARIPNCKHAFLPRHQATGNNRIGVEHATPDSIRNALLNVRSTNQLLPEQKCTFSLDDLQEAGLVGSQDAALRRKQVGDNLRIGYANAKSFLRKLNVLGVTLEEWNIALQNIDVKGKSNGN